MPLEEGNTTSSNTIGSRVSRCMFIKGTIKSCEPILIDGRVTGDIECEDRVEVNRGAFVKGAIVAKVVNINGRVEGPIEAQIVKIEEKGVLEGYIIANRVVIKGLSDGEVLAKEYLRVDEGAKLIAYEVNGFEVLVSGKIIGKVVANNLNLKKSAIIEGDVIAKELKSQIGSKIFGSVNRYKENIKKNNDSSREKIEKSEEVVKKENKVIRKIRRLT